MPVAYARGPDALAGPRRVLHGRAGHDDDPGAGDQPAAVRLYAHIGWIGTLKPLIVPAFFGDAFSIFLLRQFFLTLPQETIEAARVDGAGEFRILRQVVVPMARPAIAAVGLFAFMYAWNDFYNPLLYTGNSTTGRPSRSASPSSPRARTRARTSCRWRHR